MRQFILVCLLAALVGCSTRPSSESIKPGLGSPVKASNVPGQLSIAGVSLGDSKESVQEKLGPPTEIIDPGHPRYRATVLFRYQGMEILLQKDQDSVLSIKATQDWQGPIVGEVKWRDTLSEVREKLQTLGSPIEGDRQPGSPTVTYLSADKSYGVLLLFNESSKLIEAQLTRQVPGSDYQGP